MKKDSLIAGIILIVTLIGIIFVIPQLVERDDNTILEKEQIETELRQSRSMLESAKRVKEDFEDLTPVEQESMIEKVPENLDQPSIIDQLAGIGEKNESNLSSVTFSKQKGEAGKKIVSIIANFRNQGSSNPAPALIAALEKNDRLFNIKSLTLLFSSNRSDFSITMEAYYKE